jgi:hypothetical protein
VLILGSKGNEPSILEATKTIDDDNIAEGVKAMKTRR